MMTRLLLMFATLAAVLHADDGIMCVEGPAEVSMNLIQYSNLPPGAQSYKIPDLARFHVSDPADFAVSLTPNLRNNIAGLRIEIYSGVEKMIFEAKAGKPCSKDIRNPMFVFEPGTIAAARKAWLRSNVLVVRPKYRDAKLAGQVVIRHR